MAGEFPFTVNGRIYYEADFAGYSYVTGIPRLAKDLAIVAQAAQETFQILSLSRPPVAGDVAVGAARLIKSAGRISLWANDGGTLVDLLSFAPDGAS